MSKLNADRMTVSIAAFGIAATILCFVLGGAFSAWSAALGAALGLINFIFLRSILARVVGREISTTGPFVFLLFLKMGGLMAAVFIVIARGWVSAIPFTVGLTSLVVGLLTASFVSIAATHSATASTSTSETES